MLKRTLIVLSMTIAMIVALQPLQTVHGIIMTEAEWLMMNSAPAANGQTEEDRGNGFVRALKAPFKAIGRLFGGGKKDKNKVERISAKDVKKFESAQSAPVKNTGLTLKTPVEKQPTSNPSPADLEAQNSKEPNSAPQVSSSSPETAGNEHLEKGRALLNEHDLNGAIGELSIALSLDPKSCEVNSLLGIAYWRKGLRDRAQTSFEAAIRTEKPDPQYLNNLGYLLYETGQYEKAIKYLKQAAKLAPNDARILNNLGLAQAEEGHYDDAYKSFARALGEFGGHLNIAARLERHGQAKKAIKHLEQALAIQPNSADVLARLVNLYDREGKQELAQSARISLVRVRTMAEAAAK